MKKLLFLLLLPSLCYCQSMIPKVKSGMVFQIKNSTPYTLIVCLDHLDIQDTIAPGDWKTYNTITVYKKEPYYITCIDSNDKKTYHQRLALDYPDTTKAKEAMLMFYINAVTHRFESRLNENWYLW